jgi:hypothetical protein
MGSGVDRCEVFRAMFLEQKKASDGKKAEDQAPLVLPDVRPTGMSSALSYSLAPALIILPVVLTRCSFLGCPRVHLREQLQNDTINCKAAFDLFREC